MFQIGAGLSVLALFVATAAGTLRDETLLLKNKDGNVIVYLTGQGTNKNICLITTREVVFDG